MYKRPENEGFATRLRGLLSDQGKSVDDVARCLGVSYEMGRRYVTGIAQPKNDRIAELAAYLGTTTAYLVAGKGPAVSEAQQSRLIPVFQFDKDGVEQTTSSGLTVPFGQFGRSAFAYIMDSDTMTGLQGYYIAAGSVLVVDPNREPKSGDVTLCLMHNTPTVGQFSALAGRSFLRFSNASYPTIEIDEKSRVIGTVVHWSYSPPEAKK